MAELLINNRADHGDRCFGDVVAVRPNGHRWSDSELPKVVKIPDLPYAKARVLEEFEITPVMENGKQVDIEQGGKKFKVSNIKNKTIYDKKAKEIRSVDWLRNLSSH